MKTSGSIAWLVLSLGVSGLSFAQTGDIPQKPVPRAAITAGSDPEVPDALASRSYPTNAVAAIIQETSHGGKLSAPLTLEVSRGKPIDAETQELLITISCSIPAAGVDVAAEAVQGATLLGDTKWHVRLTPGTTKTIPVSVRLGPTTVRRLLVAATISSATGETQSVADSYLLQQPGESTVPVQRGLLPGARLVRGPNNGRPVQEVPARNH